MQNMITTLKAGILGIITVVSGWFGLTPEQPVNQSTLPPIAVEQQPDEASFGAYGITGGGTYRLKASIGSSDTTINLSSFKEPVSDIAYTMTYLDTTVSYGTIDPQTTRPEFISFTGITQNSDGSAALTGVTRGLSRTPQGEACVASTTLAVRHPGQSIFILSDSPCHFAEYAAKKNDETITGYWKTPTPLAATDIANKAYVDSVVTGGTLSTDNVTMAAVAGETMATGTIIYYDRVNAQWFKADADATSTTYNLLLGIAQGTGTAGNNITNGVMISGRDTNQGSTLTNGQRLWLSGTAGATSTAPGTNPRVLGIVKDNNEFYFNPVMLDEYEVFTSASSTRLVSTNSTSTNATTTRLSINGVSYDWPSTQATASSTVLSNNGSGSLSWSIPGLLVADGTTYQTTSNASTTVFTYKLPAGTLSAIGGLKIEANTFTAITGASTASWDIQFGTGSASTTVSSGAYLSDVASQVVMFTTWIYNNNSATSQAVTFSAIVPNITATTASSSSASINTANDSYVSFRARNVNNTGAAIGFKGITITRLGQ